MAIVNDTPSKKHRDTERKNKGDREDGQNVLGFELAKITSSTKSLVSIWFESVEIGGHLSIHEDLMSSFFFATVPGYDSLALDSRSFSLAVPSGFVGSCYNAVTENDETRRYQSCTQNVLYATCFAELRK